MQTTPLFKIKVIHNMNGIMVPGYFWKVWGDGTLMFTGSAKQVTTFTQEEGLAMIERVKVHPNVNTYSLIPE